MNGSVLITRVVLKNCESIATCLVSSRGLVLLVGSNSSGKSHFLDALRDTHSTIDQGL